MGLHDNFAEFTKSEKYLFYSYIVTFINELNRFHGPLYVTPHVLQMAVLPQGVLVMIAACVCGHCLSDINQATPSEQFMNDFRIHKKKSFNLKNASQKYKFMNKQH